MNRRDFLRLSLSTPLGLSTFSGVHGIANANSTTDRKFKPVIVFFLTGGAPRQETFDPCVPDAPVEFRGDRKRVETSIPGVYFSDYWPRLAAVADKCALLRGLDSESGDHFKSAENMLLAGDTTTLGVRWGERAASGGPPYMFIKAPSSFAVMESLQVNRALACNWKRDEEPKGEFGSDWERDCASRGRFAGPELKPDPKLADRAKLLRAFDTAKIEGPAVARRDANLALALELLQGGGGRFSEAFTLPVRDVERYGDTMTGKGLLLARRLVDAGAGFVCYYNERGNGWDVHSGMYDRLAALCGEADRAAAALIDDISKGRLDCLFVVTTEFGRTPKVNSSAGRDHWGEGFSTLLCGAKTKAGVVHGRTHHTGRVVDGRVPSKQLGPTIVHLAGGEELLNPATQRIREVIRA